MPIHEFYCPDCHRIFNFLARRPGVTRRPACPRCARPALERKMSRFAIGKGLADPAESSADMDLPPGLDEEKMERVMTEMAAEMDAVDDENPRQMAGLMRKLGERTGLRWGDAMEEAMRRMEAGEDPDAIEAEMGDLLEGDDISFDQAQADVRQVVRKLRPPQVDETLYEL